MSNDNRREDENINRNEEPSLDDDGDGEEGIAAAAIAAALNNESIGYCHVCDKQVVIEPESFTCSECHGGFIELFESDNREQIPQGNNQNDSQRARLDPVRLLNETNMSSLLPLLLPQLLNQNLNQNIRFSQVTQVNTDQNQGASATNQNQPQSNQNQANPQMAHRIGPTTRLQFIVPGEQFDLYGVINNVLSDLLDPRRHGMQTGEFTQRNIIPPNNQFHFQPPPIRMFQLHGDLRDYAWGATGLDTIITQLLNQLENTGPPPASEQQLQNLPIVKINQEEFDKNVQCSICMEDFKIDEEAKKLPCKHYFHPSCILEWLKLHGTCPVCRKNLNGEDTSQREYVSRAPPPSANPDAAPSTSTDTTSSTISNETNPQGNLPVPPSTTEETGNNQNRPASDTNPSVYYDMDFD